jgi:2'-5' RNA ligase
MKRTFIATKINPGTKFLNTYTKLKNELENEKIKWVDKNNFHLTLFFLGDTSEEQINQVRLQLSNIADQFQAFQIKLKGLGVFKNFHKPRVLWAGIYEYEYLRQIKEYIDKEMLKIGFNPDAREFKPHLTISRIKWVDDKDKLKKLVKEHEDVFFEDQTIREITFYESILRPEGPEYKPIEKFALPG